MLIVSYDMESDHKRTRFSKFLKKFGYRMQYSVYNIKNSPRVLQNILNEVKCKYEKGFGNTDTVIIVHLCEACKKKVIKMGYAKNDNEETVIFS